MLTAAHMRDSEASVGSRRALLESGDPGDYVGITPAV